MMIEEERVGKKRRGEREREKKKKKRRKKRGIKVKAHTAKQNDVAEPQHV